MSCFTLSLKCFSSDSDNCPDVGIGPLLQFPHLLRADVVLEILLFFPPSSFTQPSFAWHLIFFPWSGTPVCSQLLLPAVLCLKVCSWCIHGERCPPHPPAPLPSHSLSQMDACELWSWRRLLRVPRTARRSNQSIIKEISAGCSLEGLMLKLKLQCFGHLMWKTLKLGKIEGRRRRMTEDEMVGWHHRLHGSEF